MEKGIYIAFLDDWGEEVFREPAPATIVEKMKNIQKPNVIFINEDEVIEVF